MESTPRLYETLVYVLSQHANWVDRRHLKTLAWMMVGLMQARVVSLTAWAPYVHSRAVYAQSLVRRFDRWLQNKRIEGHQLYGPLIQHALAEWGTNAVYLALDTSTLWDTYCLVRDERSHWCGRCFNIPAVVLPMLHMPIYWTRLRHCFHSNAR
jgi:hypothetical protein